MSKAPVIGALLQDAQTTGNGNSVDLRGLGTRHSFYITGNGAVGAGAIQCETARDMNYTGTWAALGAPVAVVANATVVAQFEGSFRAIRARISTGVTGGRVTVKLVSGE